MTSSLRDDFDSISEGCFLVLPHTSQINTLKTNKRKRQSAAQTKVPMNTKRRLLTDQAMANSGFQPLFSGREPTKAMLLRQQAYQETWQHTSNIMDNVLLDLNHAVRQQICHFVNGSDDLHQNSFVRMPYHEIPTALIFAGINTPDHTTQFSEIANTLRQSSHYVSLLASQSCHSLKAMMATMIEQFIEHDHSVFDTQKGKQSASSHQKQHQNQNLEENEEEQEKINDDNVGVDGDHGETGNDTKYQLDSSTYLATKPTKLPAYDLQILLGWYKAVQQKQKQKISDSKLVIILQDFESFDPSLLQDFMTIISEYRIDIPFVFVIGIATSTEILHQSLTKSTLCLLRIEKFWLQQSDVWFNRVLDMLFIDSTDTLKFGAKPYKFLLDHFYLYDFSIQKVKNSIQYALMHHFYSNPLSLVTRLVGQPKHTILATLESWREKEQVLTDEHAVQLRMLRSFRQTMEQLAADPEHHAHALQLLNDDTYLLTHQLATWLTELADYQRNYQRGMRLLAFLQAQFPAFTGLRTKTRRLLYLEQLENPKWQQTSDTLQWIITLVRKMEPSALDPFLSALHTVLPDESSTIIEWQEQLARWQSADEREKQKMKRKEERLQGMLMPEQDHGNASIATATTTMTGGGGTRHTKTAGKVVENAMNELRHKGTVTSKMTMAIGDWLQIILQRDLRSYTTLAMHELIYYPHVKLHEKSFAPQPRGSIQTALSQSHYYLNCDCCGDHKDTLLPSEQDTSLLYKLYLECGRMINLYDWFVAFGCIIEREQRPSQHPLNENEVQARFIRSVAELQFLGFIKSTQRKTDHVIRLTWSNI